MKDIFKYRENIFPEEYPEMMKFVDAINDTMWFHKKWDMKGDISDFNNVLVDEERGFVKRGLLAISQIEVKVKTFWVDLKDIFPKPEIISVGVTFGESEVRHERAYRHLLDKLNMLEDFEKIDEIPVLRDRLKYLSKYLKLSKVEKKDKKKFLVAITLFTLLIENTSLFGIFFAFKVLHKERNVLHDVDNIIIDTTKEENIHALFGIHLINILKEEHPDLFDDDYYKLLNEAVYKSLEAEEKIVDWMFDGKDLPYLKRSDVIGYIKYRLNYSLELLGEKPEFKVSDEQHDKFEFFELEQDVTIHVDFFHQHTPNYNKHSREGSHKDLF